MASHADYMASFAELLGHCGVRHFGEVDAGEFERRCTLPDDSLVRCTRQLPDSDHPSNGPMVQVNCTAFCRSHPRLVPMNTQSGILCDPASRFLHSNRNRI